MEKQKLERMEGLVNQKDLDKFKLEVMHIIDSFIDEGFMVNDIKEYLALQLEKTIWRIAT